ncbi:diguanylate cyclase [candidate division WOR-3 bacterium]|nr:diguanylate cyclase [candidate division WOR-3 bacterium]
MGTKQEDKKVRLLRKIDDILGSSYNIHKVIRRIYKEISRVMDTSNFYIAIHNPAEKMISFEIYMINGVEQHVASRQLSKGLTEYVIKSKKPLRINSNVKQFCKKIGVKPVGRNAKSWLGVPMIYKNNVEGVITIQNYKKAGTYSIEDERFLVGIAARAAVVVANTRLIEEEVRRAKELELMNQIAHRLTRSLSVSDICESVSRTITQKFTNMNVAIFLLENGTLILKKLSKGFSDDVPRNLVMHIGEGIVGSVAGTGQKIVVNDVTKEKRYISFGQSSTCSEATIPLKVSQRTIGVLDIECNELNAFNANTVRILELIADRLSVAMHNARLYEEATGHAKELAVSFTIAKSLISALALDEVLNKILEVIRTTFGFTNVAILLIDKEKNELYIRAAHGYSRNIMKRVRLKVGEHGVCGHVAGSGELYYAPDISKIPFYVKGKGSIRSEAAIPLKIRDEVIGVLDIESDTLDAFTARDLRLFSVFASQAAVAIENARLYDETKALSLTDALTRIANRRHFDLMLETEIRKARGYSRPLTLAMIDLDNFKSFNDRFGHMAGDKMLLHIANSLKRNTRDTDFVARYGGEEFAIIFPETNNEIAMRVSQRVRSAIERDMLLIRGIGRKKLTVSIGLATYPLHAEGADTLLKGADTALYRAKQKGKNRVETIE